MICVGPTLADKEISRLREQYEFAPEIEEEAEWHSAMAHPIRLKIMRILAGNGAVCVCDLRDILGVSSSVVSQHLAKLKAYRFVNNKRDGQTVFYSLGEHPFLSGL